MESTPEQIAEFLDKLDTDDDFRDKLKSDPASVFEEYGISYDPEKTPPPDEIQLPAKGEIAKNIEAYKDAMFPGNEFVPHIHWFRLNEPSS